MMAQMGSGLDGYTLKARYVPALIVVLPLWLAFAVWFPRDDQFLGVFASAGVTLVLSMLLAQIGRDAGKKRQQSLFDEWGGPPTVRALSYRSGIVNPVSLARCHAAIRALEPEIQLPANAEEESADWPAASCNYESASDFMREATRDKSRFRLVYAENVNYGFRRNLWAMKPAGIAIAVTASAAVATHAARAYLAGQSVSGLEVASFLLCVALLALWALRFTKDWVKTAADEYSSRLVAAGESLAQGTASAQER